jgi:acyl carrier protein
MPDITFEAVVARLGSRLAIPAARLTPTTPLTSLAVDSFGLVEIVIDLQEEFGVRFGQAELVGARTLGDLVALLRGKTRAAQG